MQLADNVKPISYLKSNTAEVAKALATGRESLIITCNGVPSFVCMDIRKYDQLNEMLALVQVLNMDSDDEGTDFNESMQAMKKEIFG